MDKICFSLSLLSHLLHRTCEGRMLHDTLGSASAVYVTDHQLHNSKMQSLEARDYLERVKKENLDQETINTQLTKFNSMAIDPTSEMADLSAHRKVLTDFIHDTNHEDTWKRMEKKIEEMKKEKAKFGGGKNVVKEMEAKLVELKSSRKTLVKSVEKALDKYLPSFEELNYDFQLLSRMEFKDQHDVGTLVKEFNDMATDPTSKAADLSAKREVLQAFVKDKNHEKTWKLFETKIEEMKNKIRERGDGENAVKETEDVDQKEKEKSLESLKNSRKILVEWVEKALEEYKQEHLVVRFAKIVVDLDANLETSRRRIRNLREKLSRHDVYKIGETHAKLLTMQYMVQEGVVLKKIEELQGIVKRISHGISMSPERKKIYRNFDDSITTLRQNVVDFWKWVHSQPWGESLKKNL